MKVVMEKLDAKKPDEEEEKPAEEPKPADAPPPEKTESTEEVKLLRKSVSSVEDKLEKLSAIMLHVLEKQGEKLNG